MARTVRSNIGFKKILGIKAAKIAPNNPPNMDGIRIGMIAGRSRILCLSYPAMPVADCIKIATRFVPLAMSAGKPNIISAGKVMFEPPPATVLMPPATNPVKESNNIDNMSNCIELFDHFCSHTLFFF